MLIKTNHSTLKTSDGKVLLRNIKFVISRGEFIHVSGANGSGKSSLFKAILGLEALNINFIEKNNFSYFYLPQIENKDFLLPLKLKELVQDQNLLNSETLNLKWNQASGGERKKTMVHRALEADADVYILDEPYNHLDDEAIKIINSKIEKLLLENKTIILISHKKPEIITQKCLHMDVNSWSS